MKVKRLTAMFLMFSLVFMLIGCGSEQTPSSEGNNTPDRDSESNVLDSEAQNIPVEEAKILPDLPERDFGGHEFIIITRDYTANLDLPQEIGAEEETGASINDAIYRRNKKIEEQFNVTVKEILHDGDMAASVNREIMTGDNSYELITGHLNALGIMAQRGNLLDLKKVNYLDLGRPWYDQNAAADLSIGNRLFFAIGELQVSNKDGTWSVLFNKKLFADLGFEDPYVLAREGKWTMDKMFEFATEGTRDLNGDGAMGEEDQWGMLGETFNIWALMNGSGTRLVQKDENDLPFYSGYTQRDIDIFEKGAAYLSDKSKSLLPSFRPTEPKFIEVMFQTGRVLFYFTSMSRVTHR